MGPQFARPTAGPLIGPTGGSGQARAGTEPSGDRAVDIIVAATQLHDAIWELSPEQLDALPFNVRRRWGELQGALRPRPA